MKNSIQTVGFKKNYKTIKSIKKMYTFATLKIKTENDIRMLYLCFVNYTLPAMLKDRRHSKKIIKIGLDIQTISTKRTDKQSDRVLRLGQVTEKEDIANASQNQNSCFLPTPNYDNSK
jgi:hypothetical protein